jgi:hypothetical protein
VSIQRAFVRPLYRRTNMQGFITECDLQQADAEFPGIAAYYASLADKPRTFLELVALFDHWCDEHPDQQAA